MARKSKSTIAAEEAEQKALAEDKLHAFGLALTKHRDEWVQARVASGVERRWLDDLAHYHGRDIGSGASRMIDNAADGGRMPADKRRNLNAERGSRVFVNITRAKTNAADARIGNMLFPVDEKNWGITPTPVPELSGPLTDPNTNITSGGKPISKMDGSPLTAADMAQHERRQETEEANKRSKAMEKEIDDQLTECQYNSEGRKVIASACRIGTGIMKGPIVRGVADRKWRSTQVQDPATGRVANIFQVEIIEKNTPASACVSPWDVFPDPCCGNDPHNGAGIWERSRLTPRKLRNLAKVPGYFADKISETLREKPQRTNIYDAYQSEVMTMNGIDYSSIDDSRYELWTYTGEIKREDMEIAGVTLPEEMDLQTVSGVVVVVNSRVIKAHLNPLDTGELPYDFFVFEHCEGSPWGYGVPYLMRTGQRVINAGWRQAMDNAGASAGPQIVMKRGAVTPADGVYELRGRKLWFADDETVDVRGAMAVFQVDSRLQDLIAIIEFAMKFVDDETGIPMLLQGERGTAPDTVGGMTMLMNSANELLRKVAKQFDDTLTTPHIRRYYDFNMQYSPKDEIKGDLQVDARGTSALVVRDLQNQAIIQMLLLANNPIWAPGLKKWEMLRKAFAANHLDAAEFVESDDVINGREQQMANQPPDPAIQVEQMRNQMKMEQLKFERESKAIELDTQKRIAILDYAREVKLSEAKLKAMLADTAMGIKNKRELFAAEAALKLSPRNPTNQGI